VPLPALSLFRHDLFAPWKNPAPAPHLFQPLFLRSVTLRNHSGVSPMRQYSATDDAADE